MRAARLLGMLACVALAAACAKVAPPPGGPEDTTSPSVVLEAVQPAPGSWGVARDATVQIVFSERTDRRSVLRSLAVFPAVDFGEASWSGDTLRLRPDSAWATERMTIVRVGPGAEDRRGNRLAAPFTLRFTTKAVPDSGRIRGRVWAGRERTASSRTVVVALAADTSRSGADPYALADAAESGEFVLEGLDRRGVWRVAALLDRDGDARAEDRDESWSFAKEVVRFEDGATEATVPDFLAGSLDSLGRVRGEVRADSADTVRVEAVRSDGVRDVSPPLPGGGAFALEVPTGYVYRLAAFADRDGDAAASGDEPVVRLAEEVRLDLAAERGGITFDLSTPKAPVDSLEGTPAPEGESP